MQKSGIKEKRIKENNSKTSDPAILSKIVKNWPFGVDIKCAKTTEKPISVIAHLEIMDSKTNLHLFYTNICL